MTQFDEGDCPACKSGTLVIRIKNCSCHICPPCGACTSAVPACDQCGWDITLEVPVSESAKAQWGIVSLMGHKTLAGKISEEERFGAKMGRIDVPGFQVCAACGDAVADCDRCNNTGKVEVFTTTWFGGSSVYSLQYTDEETTRHAAESIDNEPPGVYSLRNQVLAECRDALRERERAQLPKPAPAQSSYDPDDDISWRDDADLRGDR